MEKQLIVHEIDFQKARRKIRESQKDGSEIIFSSNNDELNRKILEKEKINVLLLSLSERKDWMKQRNSGFNQVLAKLAKKNNVSIGIDFDEIINAEKKVKSKIIARVRQNVKLCNKNKLKMKFISKEKRDIYNLRSLGLILGMPTWMTKEL